MYLDPQGVEKGGRVNHRQLVGLEFAQMGLDMDFETVRFEVHCCFPAKTHLDNARSKASL